MPGRWRCYATDEDQQGHDLSAALVAAVRDLCIQVQRLDQYSQMIEDLLREVGRWKPDLKGQEIYRIRGVFDVAYDTGENVAENDTGNDEKNLLQK